MNVVADASAVVAALIDTGPVGRWAEELLLGNEVLAGPPLVHAEVANVLRRAAATGDISQETATLAHVDLGDLPITLFGYSPFAERISELRHNLSSYDAWYVALAEELDTPLVTLDLRLVTAPGLRCRFLAPGTPA